MDDQYLNNDVLEHILTAGGCNTTLSFYQVSHYWNSVVRKTIGNVPIRAFIPDGISYATRRQLHALCVRPMRIHFDDTRIYKHPIAQNNLLLVKWLYKTGFILNSSVWNYFYPNTKIDISIAKWAYGKLTIYSGNTIPENVLVCYVTNGSIDDVRWLLDNTSIITGQRVVDAAVIKGSIQLLQLLIGHKEESYVTGEHLTHARDSGHREMEEFIRNKLREYAERISVRIRASRKVVANSFFGFSGTG